MGGNVRSKFVLVILSIIFVSQITGVSKVWAADTVRLPKAKISGDVSIEEALQKRRSIRSYQDQALTVTQLAQLLWAAQGISDPRGFRTAPSAGATYPLETYAVVGSVVGLEAGLYKYLPEQHALKKVVSGDVRENLASACYGQSWVRKGAVSIVFAAENERTTGRYGKRGLRYIDMEAGHASQNIYLQAVSLGLGTVAIGAFSESRVKSVLKLPDEEVPVYLMPIGRIKS